jgi:AhpC/TSA family
MHPSAPFNNRGLRAAGTPAASPRAGRVLAPGYFMAAWCLLLGHVLASPVARAACGFPPAPPQDLPAPLRTADLAERVARFEADLAAARAQEATGQPLDLAPFVVRMEALAGAGHGPGYLWLLDHLVARRLPLSEERGSTIRYLRGAFALPGGSPEQAERLLMHLAAAVHWIPRKEGQEWAYAGLAQGSPDAVRGAALWVLAEYASAAGTTSLPDDLKEADELLSRILSSFPDSRAALPARLRLCAILAQRYEQEREQWWKQWTVSDSPPDPAQHPARRWWPRFEELANLGVGPALWWQVVNADHADLAPEQRRAQRLAWMERILESHSEADWLVPAIQESTRMVDELSLAAVIDLGERLLEKSRNEEVRAWVLFTLATLATRQPSGLPRAIELLERLNREMPQHRLSAGIPARLFALKNLQVGQPAPDVEVVSPGERPVRLSDFKGRPVALIFWSYFSGGLLPRLGALQELSGRYASEDFLLLGVNLDMDRAGAQARAQAEGLRGEHLWLGEPNAAWPRTWDIHSFPTVFVLDADGIIRGRDLSAAQAVALIEDLLEPPAEAFQSSAKNAATR